MKMKRIAINGFGRIGRAALKIIIETPELEILAINDLMHIDNAEYLLRYDSVYGKYENEIAVHGSYLHIRDKKILFITEKDPSKLPWKDLSIDAPVFLQTEKMLKNIFEQVPNL